MCLAHLPLQWRRGRPAKLHVCLGALGCSQACVWHHLPFRLAGRSPRTWLSLLQALYKTRLALGPDRLITLMLLFHFPGNFYSCSLESIQKFPRTKDNNSNNTVFKHSERRRKRDPKAKVPIDDCSAEQIPKAGTENGGCFRVNLNIHMAFFFFKTVSKQSTSLGQLKKNLPRRQKLPPSLPHLESFLSRGLSTFLSSGSGKDFPNLPTFRALAHPADLPRVLLAPPPAAAFQLWPYETARNPRAAR